MKTKKLIIQILAAAMTLLMLISAFPAFAADKSAIILDAATLDAMTISKSGGTVKYDSGEDAVVIISNGTQTASFAVDFMSAGIDTSLLPYAVVISRAARTNSTLAVSTSFKLLGSGATETTQLVPHKGYRYSSTIIPVHNKSLLSGGTTIMTVSSFSKSAVNDVLLVSAVAFAPDKATAEQLGESLTAAADASRSAYNEDVLTLAKYDLERYSVPYNEGNLVYSEAVFPLEEKDGTMAPIELMYSADRIVSVRSSDYVKEYTYGVDYILEDGKLVILDSGRIPTIDYSTQYYSTKKANAWNFKSRFNGLYVDTTEHYYYHDHQLAVTYTHTDTWSGPVIENQGDGIPLTTEKLLNGDDINIVFFGDSITGGGNSSAEEKQAPFAEVWPDQVPKMLSRIYSTSGIHASTVAYGGGTASSAYSMASANVLPCNPDVVVLAFGMNEAMNGDSASEFGDAIENIIDTIRAVKPQCEFVLVSSMRSNKELFNIDSQFDQVRELEDICRRYTGIIMCDVTNAHEYLLTIKKYSECSANNLCHANDYTARLYTQSILAAMFTPDYDSFKRIPLARYNNIINKNNYTALYQAEIDRIITDAKAKTNAASTVAQSETILRDTANALAALPTKATTSVDTSRLIMTSDLVNRIAVGATNNAVPSFDATENALAVTITGDGTDPYITLDLSCGMTDITDKKYMTLTYRTDSANSDAATNGEVFICAGELYYAISGASVRTAYSADASEYHSVTLDLSDSFFASGVLHSLRLDVFEGAAAGDKLYIDSIIFSENDTAAHEAEESRLAARGVSNETLSCVFDSYSDVTDATVTAHDTYNGGELTGDGRVNALDALRLKLYLNGKVAIFATGMQYADINSDGRVNALDALRIKLFLVGKTELGMVEGADYFTSEYDADEAALVLTATSNKLGTPCFTLDMGTLGISADTNEVSRIALTGRVIKADKSTSDIEATAFASDGTTIDTTAFATFSITSGDETANITASCADSTLTEFDSLKMIFDGIEEGDRIAIRAVTLAPTQARLDDRCDTLLRTLELGAGSTPVISNGNFKLDFTVNSALSLITFRNNTTAGMDDSEGAMKLTVSGTRTDPWIYLDLSSRKMSADEYKYIVISYKYPSSNATKYAQSEVFLSAGSITAPTAEKSVTFTPTCADSYSTQVIDLTQTSFWNGSIYSLRLDYFCDAALGSIFFLDSITLCKSTDGVNEVLNSAR